MVDVPNLAGFPPSLPFIVLFAVLLFTPKGRFVEAGRQAPGPGARVDGAPRWRGPGGPPWWSAWSLAPQVVGTRLPVYSNALIFILVFLSLRLLVQTSGQVSLCHAAFAAMGAAAFSHFAHGVGLPWLVALVLAGLATVPVGAMVAIPAIRLSGLYLALATFGFGLLVERMVFGTGLMFGGRGSRPAPRPGDLFGLTLGSDKGFYYVALGRGPGRGRGHVVAQPVPPRSAVPGHGRLAGGAGHARHQRPGHPGAGVLCLGLRRRPGRRAVRRRRPDRSPGSASGRSPR